MGVLIAVATSFAWLAQQVTPIAAYGVAAVILAGIALACVALLALGALGIAWSLIFRPQSLAQDKSKAANQYLSGASIASGWGDSVAVQPQLSPGEKDRLSNVLFGLSQILTGQGEPIITKASAFSRTHTIGQGLKDNVNPDEQMAKLAEIRTDLTALYDSIYNNFLQKNSYYQFDITQLIQSQLPIENMKEVANSYINVWNIVSETPGLDKAKKGGLIDLPHRDFFRTLNDFQQWLIACDQRIGQKRVALR